MFDVDFFGEFVEKSDRFEAGLACCVRFCDYWLEEIKKNWLKLIQFDKSFMKNYENLVTIKKYLQIYIKQTSDFQFYLIPFLKTKEIV